MATGSSKLIKNVALHVRNIFMFEFELLKDVSEVVQWKNTKISSCRLFIRNIDFVPASAVEDTKMFISRRSLQLQHGVVYERI